MVSLTKIRNLIKAYRNRKFRTSTRKEKNQKYLFRDRLPETTRWKWNIFRKNGERLSPFSRFLQDKIQITRDVTSSQEYYLKYIGLFLISTCIYIVAYSPYFLISPSKILIEGLDEGIDTPIAYRSVEDLYGKNIFFLDEKEVADSLKKYQKNISLIRIDRLYPNNIKILLSGYPIIFDVTIPTVRDKKWWMTENGVLVPKDHLEKIPKYKLNYIDTSLNNDILLDYRELIPESEAQIIKKTIDLFSETWPDISIENIVYLKRENELHIILKNTVRILFTLQDFTKKSWEVQNYNHLRIQLLSIKRYIESYRQDIIAGKYIYIDARIPGKIFSCREKEICTKNLSTIYPEITPEYAIK